MGDQFLLTNCHFRNVSNRRTARDIVLLLPASFAAKVVALPTTGQVPCIVKSHSLSPTTLTLPTLLLNITALLGAIRSSLRRRVIASFPRMPKLATLS